MPGRCDPTGSHGPATGGHRLPTAARLLPGRPGVGSGSAARGRSPRKALPRGPLLSSRGGRSTRFAAGCSARRAHSLRRSSIGRIRETRKRTLSEGTARAFFCYNRRPSSFAGAPTDGWLGSPLERSTRKSLEREPGRSRLQERRGLARSHPAMEPASLPGSPASQRPLPKAPSPRREVQWTSSSLWPR